MKKQLIISVDDESEIYRASRAFSFSTMVKKQFHIIKLLLQHTEIEELSKYFDLEEVTKYLLFFDMKERLDEVKAYMEKLIGEMDPYTEGLMVMAAALTGRDEE